MTQDLIRGDLIVLDHRWDHAGHRRHQVEEVPRVGVVVIDHDHVGSHLRRLVPRPARHHFVNARQTLDTDWLPDSRH